MVTLFCRDNVYVDIRVLNECDIDHLTVPFQLMERPHSLKWHPNKAFSGLEGKKKISAFSSKVHDLKSNIYLTRFILHLIRDTFDFGGKTF